MLRRNKPSTNWVIHQMMGGPQFLYLSKLSLAIIVVWIISLLIRQVTFVNKFVEPPLAAASDDELFLDISQVFELPFQQDLSFTIGEGIKSGDIQSNCGLPVNCEANQFAVHLFTGKENTIYPKLCINGKYILDKGLNGCGRGINLVVIDNITRSILRVSNFDTYAKDSQPLEALLLTLRIGDILIMITFDEPTSKLSKIAKLLLHEIGSNSAQNLMYRSSWYIITQKGINGYTPYENLNLPFAGGWAESHEIRLCVPLQIKGLMVQPDPIIVRNPRRVHFCEKYWQQFPLFCEGNVINDPLIPARILKNLPISHEIVKTPIIVLTAQSYAQNVYLPLTLETIIRQPGITARNVIVYYDSVNCPLIAFLAEIFNFMSNDLSDFDTDLDEVLRTTELLFPDAKAFIIIDINILLAPDFIPYMAQSMAYILADGLGFEAVSAWNDNGFKRVSNDSKVVYRANSKHYRPRFAAMFKRGFKFNLSSNMLWSFTEYSIENDVIIPDVSRVLYLNHESSAATNDIQEFNSDFMQQKRTINLEDEVLLKLNEMGNGMKYYAQSVDQMLKQSFIASDVNHLERLMSDRTNNSKQIYSIFCDSAVQCRQVCADLGLANCLPHMIIPNIGGFIKFSKRMGDTIILVNKTYQ